jgi:hypothetical protein
MHPPFFHVDHKVGPVVHTAPLRADPAPPQDFVRPAGPMRLGVVPPPRMTLRDRIGRFLIRTGQRMIFQNHARRV